MRIKARTIWWMDSGCRKLGSCGASVVRISLLFGVSTCVGAVLADEPVPATTQPAAAGRRAKNLIRNGDFEEGKITPVGWQTIDGLSSFWVQDDDPAHGKVLKFDSDVLQSQAYDWWAKIAAGASPQDAPGKLPTDEPKYDTLAGLDGVWFWSDPFPVKKRQAYWLTVDVKGAEMFLWLVGYPEKPSTDFGADAAAFQGLLQKKAGTTPPNVRGRKRFIHKYVWKGQLKAGGSKGWKTYSRREKPFRPTKHTPNVRYLRVLLYVYWPPGTWYVDNVKVVEVDDPSAAGSPGSERF